ncbi:MAG: TolC family protein, partial [Chlamydiales bacterium]|nr:TolC family protein [Chlamydiales bacterium]
MSHKDYTSNVIPVSSVEVNKKDYPDYSNFFTTGNWPSSNWWSVFEDKQLAQLIEIALHNNPSLKSAESKYRAAYQEALVVRSKLFPTLDAGFSDQAEKWSKNGNLIIPGIPLTNNLINNIGLNFNYEFDFWGKNRKTYEAMLGRANANLAEKKQADLMIS